MGGWRGREVGSLLTFTDFEADIVPVDCVDWGRGELGLRCHCWFWWLQLGLVVIVNEVEEDGGEEELMRCRGGVMLMVRSRLNYSNRCMDESGLSQQW